MLTLNEFIVFYIGSTLVMVVFGSIQTFAAEDRPFNLREVGMLLALSAIWPIWIAWSFRSEIRWLVCKFAILLPTRKAT